MGAIVRKTQLVVALVKELLQSTPSKLVEVLLVESIFLVDLFRLSPPPPPPVRYALPVTEHVLLHSKSLCKNVARASGLKILCTHKAGGGGGADTEKVHLSFKINQYSFVYKYADPLKSVTALYADESSIILLFERQKK